MIGVIGQVVSGSGAVLSYIQAPVTTAILIILTVYGYSVMRGAASEPYGGFLALVAKYGFIYGLVFGGIGGIAAEGVTEFPDLATSWVSGNQTNPGGRIDAFIVDINNRILAITENVDEWDLGFTTIDNPLVSLFSWLPFLAALALGAIMIVIIIFLKFALAVVALFGPLFLAAAIFETTRSWFFTWLSSAVQYAITLAIIYIVIDLIFATLVLAGNTAFDAANDTITSGSSEGAIAALLTMTAVIFVGYIFLLQSQSVAQGFTGGGGGGGADIANGLTPSAFTQRAALRFAGGPLRGAARGAANLVSRGRSSSSAANIARGNGSGS